MRSSYPTAIAAQIRAKHSHAPGLERLPASLAADEVAGVVGLIHDAIPVGERRAARPVEPETAAQVEIAGGRQPRRPATSRPRPRPPPGGHSMYVRRSKRCEATSPLRRACAVAHRGAWGISAHGLVTHGRQLPRRIPESDPLPFGHRYSIRNAADPPCASDRRHGVRRKEAVAGFPRGAIRGRGAALRAAIGESDPTSPIFPSRPGAGR